MPDQQTETRLEAIETDVKNLKEKLDREVRNLKSALADLEHKVSLLNRRS